MVINKKLRRRSGRVTPQLSKGISIKALIEEGTEPQIYWDDWRDYRDGFRGSNDRKMLRNEHMPLSRFLDVKRWNKKLKSLILRRKARKKDHKIYK